LDRYGIPKGIDAEALRAELDNVFGNFNDLRASVEFQREVDAYMQIAGRISPEDLEKQFTV
jgi:hypothetical protein